MVSFQTLAVGFIGALIAAIGAWIAARQMVIANDRLHMDKFIMLYAKRVAVYAATRDILSKAYHGVTEADIRSFGLMALDAQFLFDDEMFKYLREVRFRVEAVKPADGTIDEASPPEQAEYSRIRTAHFDWLREQGDGPSDFSHRFRPFLVHEFPKRRWWLRWPA
jgi:hypothetical protein